MAGTSVSLRRAEPAGTSLSGARWKHGHAADGAAITALALPLALIVLLRAPAMHVELAADSMEPVSEAGHGMSPRAAHPVGLDNAIPSASCHPDNHAEEREGDVLRARENRVAG